MRLMNDAIFNDLEWPLTQISRDTPLFDVKYPRNGIRYRHKCRYNRIYTTKKLTSMIKQEGQNFVGQVVGAVVAASRAKFALLFLLFTVSFSTFRRSFCTGSCAVKCGRLLLSVQSFLLFPVPDSQPTATELFQSPLYGSGTAYHICSVISCLLLSLEDILLRTLLPIITDVVLAK